MIFDYDDPRFVVTPLGGAELFKDLRIETVIDQEWNTKRRNGEDVDLLIETRETFEDGTALVSKVSMTVAHRYVLAKFSKYFRSLFATNVDYKICFGKIDDSALEMLLNFMYTGSIFINETNMCELERIAALWGFKALSDKCREFMFTHIKISNVLNILINSRCQQDVQFFKSLNKKALRFIVSNMSALLGYEAFYAVIKYPDMLRLLAMIRAKYVLNGEILLNAIIKWGEFNWVIRSKYLVPLLACAKLENLSKSYIRNYLQEKPFLKRNYLCVQFFRRLLKNQRNNNMYVAPITQPAETITVSSKISGTSEEVLYISYEQELIKFNIINMQSFRVKSLSRSRWEFPNKGFFTSILNEDILFIMGGYSGYGSLNYELSTVAAIELDKGNWRTAVTMMPNMTRPRRQFPSVIFNNHIYVFGGRTGHLSIPYVEMLSLKEKATSWTELPSFPDNFFGRCSAGAAIFNDSIVVVGGCRMTKERKEDLDSVYSFNTESHQWTKLPSLNFCRSKVGVIQVGQSLYVVGGESVVKNLKNESFNYHTSVEVLHPESEKWVVVSHMNVPRVCPGAFAVDGRLYVIGGDYGGQDQPTLEIYEPDTDKWSLSPLLEYDVEIFHGIQFNTGCLLHWH